MKKQILFIAFLVLAAFASVTKSYGQVTYTNYLGGAAVPATAAALPCATDDASHPLPGKVYTYTVTVPAGSTVHWFVSDVATVIDGSGATPVLASAVDDGTGAGDYILTSTGTYNVPTNTSNTVNISWKAFDGVTHRALLVALVKDNSTCAINNVQVYRINPSFSFTLDMVALLDGGTQGSTECISNIESATYVPGALPADPGTVTMNYGENWVYFSVTAANFVGSWMPTFTTASFSGSSTVPAADIQWAYPADATANTTWHAVTDAVEAQVAGGAVGATGESIVVRVRIVHGSNEGAGTLTFGIDGTMINPATSDYTTAAMRDMDDVAGACVNNHTDEATYVLSPRPTIVSATGTPVVPFLIKN